jgi:hypothetical protein
MHALRSKRWWRVRSWVFALYPARVVQQATAQIIIAAFGSFLTGVQVVHAGSIAPNRVFLGLAALLFSEFQLIGLH